MALPVSWLNTKREAGRQAVISPCAFSTGCWSLDERQSAWRKEALIRGYRTARHEDQSEIALGAMVNRTKEDVARIAVENARRFLRVVTEIAA